MAGDADQPAADLRRHRGGRRFAQNAALVVVDNTSLRRTCNSRSRGADVVVHSATKYLGGHSDVVGGFVDDDETRRQSALPAERHRRRARRSTAICCAGQTLAVRPTASAATPARWSICWCATGRRAGAHLQLPDHRGHAAAAKQMRDYGAMVSFTLRGGEAAARTVAAATELFILAESLGAVESLIEHPGAMTHASTAGSPLEVPPNLLRLSVGIESTADLLADLDQALERA